MFVFVRLSIFEFIVFIDVVLVVIIVGVWCKVDLKELYLMFIKVLCVVIGVRESLVFVIIVKEFFEFVIKWLILIFLLVLL